MDWKLAMKESGAQNLFFFSQKQIKRLQISAVIHQIIHTSWYFAFSHRSGSQFISLTPSLHFNPKCPCANLSRAFLTTGIHYRPPHLGEHANNAFLFQIQEASCFQALILMEDFLDFCWESSSAGSEQPRKLLELVESNFLVQVSAKPTRGEAFLGLVLTSVEELIEEVIVGSVGAH